METAIHSGKILRSVGGVLVIVSDDLFFWSTHPLVIHTLP